MSGNDALPRLAAQLRRLSWLIVLGLLSASGSIAQPIHGGIAPPFELPVLDAEGTISLADQRGKIVVLHFGTGW